MKPLEALERLKKIYLVTEDDRYDFSIIETAFKEQQERIEELEETNHLMAMREHKNTKKLKAVEIIKDIITIDSRDIGNNRVCVIINGTSKIQKEEFDLLKEVVKKCRDLQ